MSTDILDVAEVNAVAAYLYTQMGEQMPPELEDADEEAIAFEAWALSPDPTPAIDPTIVERFINDTQILYDAIATETDPEQYMVHFYDAAKRTFDGDKKQIRTWFTYLYYIIFGFANGPRWGDFVEIYGPEEFCEMLRKRFFAISYL